MFAAWIVVAAAQLTEPATAPGPTPTAPVVRVVRLGDPAADASLRGAVLRIERKNGSFYEGLVTAADATRVVIDSTQEIPAAEIATLWTIRPARQPVAPGAFVRVVTRGGEGATWGGVVTDVADESIALQSASNEVRVKWTAVDRIEVEADRTDGIRLLEALAKPAATPAATPSAAETPASDFRERGTLELGGRFTLDAGARVEESAATRTERSGHRLALHPFAGYMIAKGVEVIGELTLGSSVTNAGGTTEAWTNAGGASVGAAYFFERRSGACFGPQLVLGYYSEGGEYEEAGTSYEYEERGWRATTGLAVRLPIGDSALVTIGAGVYESRYSTEVLQVPNPGGVDNRVDGARRGFETTVGFSMWVRP